MDVKSSHVGVEHLYSSMFLWLANQGSSSGAPLNEPVMQLSNADMDYFRQVLSMHLLSSTTYELIPKSGKV